MAVRNVSELRHRVSLEKPTPPTRDEDGYPVDPENDWEPVKTVRAAVHDVSGREFNEAHATQALDVVTVKMRAMRTVSPDNSWSIVFRGQRLYILHIDHESYTNAWWSIKASRVRPEGVA